MTALSKEECDKLMVEIYKGGDALNNQLFHSSPERFSLEPKVMEFSQVQDPTKWEVV